MRLKKLINEAVKIGGIPLSNLLNTPLVAPSVAGFNLTERCNSRCKMCHFWKKGSNNSNDLTTDQVFKVLNEMHDIGVQFVSFAAEGEIFTRKDVCDIFRHTKELGLDFAINSNGLHLPDEFIESVMELGPYSIVFGLDTTDPDNYAQIRGVSNGLSKVLASIHKLQNAGYASISIGSVILDNNLDQLIPLAELSRKESLRAIRYTAFSPVGFGVKWDTDELKTYTDPDYLSRLERTIKDVIAYKNKFNFISNTETYLAEIPQYYASGFTRFPYSCIVGYYNIQIMANGDVPICSYRGPDAIVGNVKNDSLVTLWQSEKTALERLKIKHKSCPTCWLSCFAENNMRFSGRHFIPHNLSVLKRSLKYNW